MMSSGSATSGKNWTLAHLNLLVWRVPHYLYQHLRGKMCQPGCEWRLQLADLTAVLLEC